MNRIFRKARDNADNFAILYFILRMGVRGDIISNNVKNNYYIHLKPFY